MRDFFQKMYRRAPDASTMFCRLHRVRRHNRDPKRTNRHFTDHSGIGYVNGVNMPFGTFEVHAGDFKKCKDSQCVRGKLLMKHDGKFLREEMPITEIAELEIASEENVKRLGATIGWGVVGAALLGPVGLIAGALAGGTGKNVTFVCKLKDGRKFLATAPNQVFLEMQATLFK